MTKNIFVTAVVVLLSLALCPLFAQKISKDCKVSNFSSIELQSVGNVVFTQSANYSCRMEGPAEYIEKTEITVKGCNLIISYKQKNANNIKNLTFYISAPDLTKVELAGVGNFTAKETLKLKNISFELDGVGNCEVNDLRCDAVKISVDGVGNIKLKIDCRTINASVDGVGNVTLSGKADTANLKRDGVGKISHKNLNCKNVTKKGWGL